MTFGSSARGTAESSACASRRRRASYLASQRSFASDARSVSLEGSAARAASRRVSRRPRGTRARRARSRPRGRAGAAARASRAARARSASRRMSSSGRDERLVRGFRRAPPRGAPPVRRLRLERGEFDRVLVRRRAGRTRRRRRGRVRRRRRTRRRGGAVSAPFASPFASSAAEGASFGSAARASDSGGVRGRRAGASASVGGGDPGGGDAGASATGFSSDPAEAGVASGGTTSGAPRTRAPPPRVSPRVYARSALEGGAGGAGEGWGQRVGRGRGDDAGREGRRRRAGRRTSKSVVLRRGGRGVLRQHPHRAGRGARRRSAPLGPATMARGRSTGVATRAVPDRSRGARARAPPERGRSRPDWVVANPRAYNTTRAEMRAATQN